MVGSGLQHYCIRVEFCAFTNCSAAITVAVVVGKMVSEMTTNIKC